MTEDSVSEDNGTNGFFVRSENSVLGRKRNATKRRKWSKPTRKVTFGDLAVRSDTATTNLWRA